MLSNIHEYFWILSNSLRVQKIYWKQYFTSTSSSDEFESVPHDDDDVSWWCAEKKKSASHVTLTTSRVEYFTHSWHSVKPGRRRWWRYSVECALINFWQSSHLGFVFWRENETRSVFRLTLNRLRKWSFNRNFIQFTSSIVAVNKCDRASQVETRKEKKALAIISATSHNVCAKSDDDYDYDDSSWTNSRGRRVECEHKVKWILGWVKNII